MTALQYLARRLLASLSALLSTLPTVAMESVLVLLLALAFVAQKASAAPAVVHNAPVLNGMVLVTPHSEAVPTPTDKRGFVMPKFWSAAPTCSTPMFSGVGSAYPQGQRQGFGLVTTPHAHHFRPSQALGGFLATPEGAKP